MNQLGVTLQRTYLTKNCKKKHCVTSSEIYINRLGTTTQIFEAVDYLILVSEKHSHFKKRQKHVVRKFFPTPQKKLYPCTSEIFLELCLSKRYKLKLEKNRNNSVCIKVKNFPKSRSSRPELFVRKGFPQVFSCEFIVQFHFK